MVKYIVSAADGNPSLEFSSSFYFVKDAIKLCKIEFGFLGSISSSSFYFCLDGS